MIWVLKYRIGMSNRVKGCHEREQVVYDRNLRELGFDHNSLVSQLEVLELIQRNYKVKKK